MSDYIRKMTNNMAGINHSFCKVAALITLTMVSLASQATTYYVAKSGNDTNAGTQASPWLTINHAASVVTAAGSTVLVGAGTYAETVTFAHSGTSGNPIIFNGQGVAIIDGSTLPCCTNSSFFFIEISY